MSKHRFAMLAVCCLFMLWLPSLAGASSPANAPPVPAVPGSGVVIVDAPRQMGPMEWNTDRPGKDYKNFDLPTDDPQLCLNACAADATCQAWTYVKPNTSQGFAPRCWLKNAKPDPVNNNCCVSGVKTGVPPASPGMEWNTDRPGKDYKNFDLPSDDPQLCLNACNGEAQCKAWTYVKPNTTQGFPPRCWLKNDVPNPVANACCVSGVKAAAPPLPAGMEWNTDRPGKDYKNFDLPSDDPQLCLNACNSEAQCKAWTYVKPNTTQGFPPRCWLKNDVPNPVAKTCCVSGVKAAAPPLPAGMEWNTDRPGKDYKNFDLPSDDPQLCLNACNGEAQCKAWTYVKPNTTQGFPPRCWLKNDVPNPVANNCCVSGVKSAAPPPPSMEIDTDRPGHDYKDFALSSADPQLCLNACNGEGVCKAWTYVKPGIQGAKAHCWLKDAVPPPKANACCVSGVKGAAPPPNMEVDTDRPGSDYKDFALSSADPQLCLNACAGEGVCKAWTYVKPGIQGAKAHCWLKNTVPPPVNNTCCVSGVK